MADRVCLIDGGVRAFFKAHAGKTLSSLQSAQVRAMEAALQEIKKLISENICPSGVTWPQRKSFMAKQFARRNDMAAGFDKHAKSVSAALTSLGIAIQV